MMSKKAKDAFKVELLAFTDGGLLALYMDLQSRGKVKRGYGDCCPLSYTLGHRGSRYIGYSDAAWDKQRSNLKKGPPPVTPRDSFLSSWDKGHATKGELISCTHSAIKRRGLKIIRSPFK